jgi:hypothetical protein
MKKVREAAFSATIYVAGEVADARSTIRKFCEIGLCVTVTPTTFIYTRGAEDGVAVGLTNYPRFPTTPDDLQARAELLCDTLIRDLTQSSGLVVGPKRTAWLTRRED